MVFINFFEILLLIVQREIYRSGYISGPVRLLKGQKVLPDDSALEEQGIKDGSTVNILIEPEQCISVKVNCGPKIYTKEITNAMTVKELKIELITSNEVAFHFYEFELAKVVSTGGIVVLDDDVPLHYNGVQTDTNIIVLPSHIMINILNVNGEYISKRVAKHKTIRQLKADILHTKRLYTIFDYYDVIMFIRIGDNTYMELDPDVHLSVGEVLVENDTLYLCANTFFTHHYPLFYNGTNLGKVGVVYQQSVLNLKLWTQIQTGIPVRNIRVLGNPPPKRFQMGNAFPSQNMGFNEVNFPLKDNVNLYQHNKHYIEIF